MKFSYTLLTAFFCWSSVYTHKYSQTCMPTSRHMYGHRLYQQMVLFWKAVPVHPIWKPSVIAKHMSTRSVFLPLSNKIVRAFPWTRRCSTPDEDTSGPSCRVHIPQCVLFLILFLCHVPLIASVELLNWASYIEDTIFTWWWEAYMCVYLYVCTKMELRCLILW